MYILNYFYFAVLTYALFYFLRRKQVIVTHPFHKREKMSFSGAEMFWTLLFSTGLLGLEAPMGVNLLAVRLFSLEVLCLICIGVVKNRVIWSIPLVGYTAFLLWLVIGLTYGPSVTYGIRVILKYIYPFLVTLTASVVVRDRAVFLKSSLWIRKVAIVCLVVSFVPYVELLCPGVFWYETARAINFISISSLSLVLYFYGGQKLKNLMWSAAFVLPCMIWGFRTSMLSYFVSLSIFSVFRYKIRALPILALIGVIGVGSVFYIPSVRKKMFKNDTVTVADLQEGRVSLDDVNSNARFATWEFFEKKFYKGHEMMGSGTGSTQEFFYTHNVFGGIKVMHSDIVQMKCDNGLIAVFLYFGTILLMIGHTFIVYYRENRRVIKICAITAGSTLAGVAIAMYSDNVVNYSMCTLAYPFGFYGMMLGLIKARKQRRE